MPGFYEVSIWLTFGYSERSLRELAYTVVYAIEAMYSLRCAAQWVTSIFL